MALIDIIKGQAVVKPTGNGGSTDAVVTQPRKLPTLLQAVVLWQKLPTQQQTLRLLKRLNKTMLAAMTSFGGGVHDNLRIPAAKLTILALKSYDASKGAAVSTHVFHTLKRLNRVSSLRNQIVHTPLNVRLAYSGIHAKSALLQLKLGRLPSLLLLSDATGISAKKITRILEGNAIVSLSGSLLVLGQNNTRGNADTTDLDYLSYVYQSVLPIDQKILEWSTGFRNSKVLPVGLIARRLNLSAPAVSQRRNKLQSMLSEVRGLV